ARALDLRRVGRRVDRDEQVARVHQCPLGEVDRLDGAGHARAHLHAIHGFEPAGELVVGTHLAALDRGDRDRNRGRRAGGRLVARVRPVQAAHAPGDGGEEEGTAGGKEDLAALQDSGAHVWLFLIVRYTMNRRDRPGLRPFDRSLSEGQCAAAATGRAPARGTPWRIARHRAGVSPSHCRKARKNEFWSSKPSRKATSAISSSPFARYSRASSRRACVRTSWKRVPSSARRRCSVRSESASSFAMARMSGRRVARWRFMSHFTCPESVLRDWWSASARSSAGESISSSSWLYEAKGRSRSARCRTSRSRGAPKRTAQPKYASCAATSAAGRSSS